MTSVVATGVRKPTVSSAPPSVSATPAAVAWRLPGFIPIDYSEPCQVRRRALVARRRVVGEQARHRHQAVAPPAELAHDARHGGDGLAAISAAVVQEDD